MISTAMTSAPALPQTCSMKSVPMEVDFSAVCQGSTPMIPMFMLRSMTRTPRMDRMIAHGTTRPGFSTSSPT